MRLAWYSPWRPKPMIATPIGAATSSLLAIAITRRRRGPCPPYAVLREYPGARPHAAEYPRAPERTTPACPAGNNAPLDAPTWAYAAGDRPPRPWGLRAPGGLRGGRPWSSTGVSGER